MGLQGCTNRGKLDPMARRCWSCSSFLPLLLALGCASRATPVGETSAQASGGIAIWWAPSLRLPSLAAIDRRLEEPFAEAYDVQRIGDGAEKVDQRVVINCATYFVLQPQRYEPRSEVDAAALKVEGAKCAAVRALRNAKRPTSRFDFALNSQTLATFPADLAPAPGPLQREHRDEAGREGKSWHGYDGDASLAPTAAWQARVTAAESVTNIEVLGRADFDGDGVDQVMVLTVSGGTKGSWTEVRLRVLTLAAGGAVFRVSREIPI